MIFTALLPLFSLRKIFFCLIKAFEAAEFEAVLHHCFGVTYAFLFKGDEVLLEKFQRPQRVGPEFAELVGFDGCPAGGGLIRCS